MNIPIEAVTAITLSEEHCILEDVDIAIADRRIVAMGRAPDSFTPDEVIDGRERGWAEDPPFDRWLNEKIWVAESALQEEDVYWGAALACCEMIHAGIVGFGDHYF